MTAAKTPAAKASDEPKGIVQIISRIASEAGGLAKAQSGGVPFAFRGVDAVVNHLADHLDHYGVIITNRVLDKNTTARDLPNNKAITQTDITVEYTLHAPDGSSITTEAAGLAQDHADRSAAQAQSVAFRVALLQLFHLPTTEKSPEEAGEDTQRAIDQINASAPAKPAPKAGPSVDELRTAIGRIIGDPSNDIEGDVVNGMLAKASGSTKPADWTAAHMADVLKDLNAKLGK